MLTLERLCKEISTISDDYSCWVDKHTGYKIKDIEFNTDEGYEDSGFKAISREMLEKDVADTLTQGEDKPSNKFTSEYSKIVSTVVKSITMHIGINLESQKELYKKLLFIN